VIDLCALVNEVLEELNAVAKPNEVTLEASVDTTTLRADPELLRRTLNQLGRKCDPPRAASEPRHRERGAHPDGVELRVADAGPGVAPEMRTRIFDPFVQVNGEGRPRNDGGRGLGLAFLPSCRGGPQGRDLG